MTKHPAMKFIAWLIPAWIWIVYAIGVLLLYLDERYAGMVIIALSSLIPALKFVIIIHETGHLLAAKLAGGKPLRLIIGKDHEVMRFGICRIKIILYSSTNGGMAMAHFGSIPSVKVALLSFHLRRTVSEYSYRIPGRMGFQNHGIWKRRKPC
jgi:membrane-associated protease RseP (regulator of RpoE activity)